MAELLGATAASLQIAELFAKAAIRGFSLAQQLKDAPDELLRNSQSLEDFRCLCESYQETLTANAAQINAAIRPQDVSRIQDFISRAEATLGSLEVILLHLRAHSSTTWMESKVKAVKTVRKQGDIMTHLNDLDKLKQQIQSYFVHHIWVLSMDQCAKTQTGFTALANSQQQMKEQLASQASSIDSSLQAITLGNSSIETKLTDGIISLQSAAEAVKDSVRDSHDDMVTRLRGNELTLSEDNINRLAARLVTLTSTAEQQQVVSRVSFTTHHSGLCPCQRIPMTQIFGTVGPFVFLERTLGAHQIGCKYHSGGKRVTTKKWLALGLRSTYGNTWMAALTRLLVSSASSFFRYTMCTRVFGDDEKDIPGFRRISDAITTICRIQNISAWEIEYWYSRGNSISRSASRSTPTSSHCQQYRRVLLKLYDDLRDDFNASRDWEAVQTQNGKTPLHALTDIMKLLWHEQEAVADILDALVTLLVKGATVTKDKHQLKQLIQRGVQVDSPTDLVSPLALALDWEDGFDILLKKEADTVQATEHAIRRGDVRLSKLLLATDQFYFKPNALAFKNGKREYQEIWPKDAWFHSDSILGGLLSRNSGQRAKASMPMVCKAYMSARRKLMKEAKKHFLTSELEDLGWNDSHFKGLLIDLPALKTYSKLKEAGVTLKKSLWPGTLHPIYHEERMTPEVAEILWACGFRDVEGVDEKTKTPLLKRSISFNRFSSYRFPPPYLEMLLWLLNHGAQNMFFGDSSKATFVHALASNIGYAPSYGLYKFYTHEVLENQLSMILNKAGSLLGFRPRDSCQCFCSRNGCSPIQSLMRRKFSVNEMPFFAKQELFDLWHRCCPEILAGALNYSDFCRVELFDRLGLRHTCCKIDGSLEFLHPDRDLGKSKRTEDEFLAAKLDSMMSLYEDLASGYAEHFDTFWDTWWKVMNYFIPEVLDPRAERTGPIFSDSLEECLQQIRRHTVRSMEIAAKMNDAALSWLIERVELGPEF
ncbi:hypothetical protein PG988_007903 [Apiospora saccharicola]